MLALIVSLPTAFVLPMTPLPTMRRAAVYACDAPEPAPEEASNGGIISFSERALQQLETMREKDPTGKIVLRMGVRAGGCSGMSYVMDLEKPDAVLDEADTVVDLAEGMKCAIDPKSLMFLYGMQLDYSDELIGGGFSFQNPNAEETVSIVRLPMPSIAAASFLLSAHKCRAIRWSSCGSAAAARALASELAFMSADSAMEAVSCVASAMLQHDRRTRRIAWP